MSFLPGPKRGGVSFLRLCRGGGPQRGLFKPPLLVQKQEGGGRREEQGGKRIENRSQYFFLEQSRRDPPLAISRKSFSGLFVVQKVI